MGPFVAGIDGKARRSVPVEFAGAAVSNRRGRGFGLYFPEGDAWYAAACLSVVVD